MGDQQRDTAARRVPLTFMVGPPEGWRMQPPTLTFRLPRASIKPMEVVDLPSPRGVGVMR